MDRFLQIVENKTPCWFVTNAYINKEDRKNVAEIEGKKKKNPKEDLRNTRDVVWRFGLEVN